MQIITKILQEHTDERKNVTLTGYIQQPSREMESVAKKPAMLIFPGGAYLFTSDREAEPIALAYAAKGFQTFVLRYSVGKRAAGYKPLREASEAISLIREHAEEWHVDENKIIVCGFSAGGHLAAWVGLCGENKPNAMILAYPAVEIAPDNGESNPLLDSLTGGSPTKEDAENLNLWRHVDSDSIPMFCWHTTEDIVVRVSQTIRFAQAYADAGRPFELHIYQEGEHGLALANHLTANGRKGQVDAHVASWIDTSVEWFFRNFGEPVVVDTLFKLIPGLTLD